MTDKIMIDGVDVSGCKYIFNTDFEFDTHIHCIEMCSKTRCRNNPNCLYKQLQRKEQECAKWKSYYGLYRQNAELLKKVQAVINSHPQYGVILTDIGITDLDERISKLEVDKQIEIIFKETLQECEELKEKYNQYVKSHHYNNAEFEQERNSLIQEIQYKNRYKQALEKIEEIVNEPCIDTGECKSCKCNCEHKDILNITNEVKDEQICK